MAMDIFAGANLGVSIGTAGITESTTWTEVPEISTFATSGGSSTVIDVVTFNQLYNRKLLGSKAVPDISISVNWIPDDQVHQQLMTASDTQKRIQVKLEYFQDATRTAGYYVVYNAFVSADTVAGGKDEVVTKEFTLAIDGGPVASAVIAP
ncbi:alpha-glucuronidase [Pantoea agglomerans]|uniref:phage tail tube protein n=1 Tax=Enterobacter agglomerans TaxID=549 RepID=UPI0027805AE8|nr:phage tail tube protein [Pantoea agglomerans]MDQ0629402.1 alpha-glucuronidase [Pantoea agglomerans]